MLPVLAKADSMTGPELERFRQHVRSEMYRVRALPSIGLTLSHQSKLHWCVAAALGGLS